MATKLTLRVDEELIQHAKTYAKKRGTSLSQLVSDFFAVLPGEEIDSPTLLTKGRLPLSTLPPITASLWGSLKDKGVQEEEYYAYLEEKHR
jgi:hypothetical protein